MLNKRFTFLCSNEERQMLKSLSEHLHRSQGDTVRFLIRVVSSRISNELEGAINLKTYDIAISRIQNSLSDQSIQSQLSGEM